MAERYPSSLRSAKSNRSLRRRSGTYSKNVQGDVPELDIVRAPSRSSTSASSSSMVSGKSCRMSTIVEDGDASSSRSRGPGSRRVSTLKDAPLPPLPEPSPNPASDRFSDLDSLYHQERCNDYPKSFSDVPLTPAQRSPDLERDGNPLSSYLPTPDFSRQNSIRSRISIPKLSPAVSQQGSLQRWDPVANDWKSDAATLTRNRPPLIPASSSNWTQKWPKPRLNPRSLGGLVAAIEESEGLGIDKPDIWTAHKWVLLMSILIAFGYSSVGLAYAMLTWFRGERILSFQLCGSLISSRLGTRRSHLHGGHGYLGLHHRRRIDPNLHVFRWVLWGRAEFSAHPGRLLSLALAVVRFLGGRRVFELQTIGIRS